MYIFLAKFSCSRTKTKWSCSYLSRIEPSKTKPSQEDGWMDPTVFHFFFVKMRIILDELSISFKYSHTVDVCDVHVQRSTFTLYIMHMHMHVQRAHTYYVYAVWWYGWIGCCGCGWCRMWYGWISYIYPFSQFRFRSCALGLLCSLTCCEL
jgi:hypothetical protein